MRTAGCLPGVQTEQHHTLIHHFPEDFVCKEPFHRFTDPFRYAPHPAVAEAARLVISHIDSTPLLAGAFSEGKMLGVLVCSIPEDPATVIPGSDRESLRYLAAFSGNVGGRSHIEGFVPPIFDLLDPEGHFKVREAEITELNHKIYALSNSEQLITLEAALQKANEDKEAALADYRMQMAQSRIRREEVRNETSDPHILAGLIKESQFEKAELKRLKTAWDEKIAEIQSQLQVLRDEIVQLKASRARMSDELQDWIFRQYIVHDAYGDSSSIADIFASRGLVPPGGTGECAAPKLLEYAYRNGLKPLAMGEFWYGKSPNTAVRTHGHFYPSCTSKCGPLLGYMLRGLLAEEIDILPRNVGGFFEEGESLPEEGELVIEARAEQIPPVSPAFIPSPIIIYEDGDIVVAEKPSGMPSVPTLDGSFSIQDYLTSALYLSDDCVGEGDGTDDGDRVDGNEGLQFFGVTAAHRLDMDTSGVMVFAKNRKALTNLHRQFEEHTVRKTYMARISAPDDFRKSIGPETMLPPCPQGEGPATKSWEGLFPDQCFSGAITLPLSPDYDERPRQKVDFQQGKPSHTDYKVVNENPDGTTDLLLYPRTGRTHQLRVHCAHTLGLGRPILGDLLYGGWSAHPTSSSASDSASTLTSDTASHPTHRLHLHALSITFKHPTTGEELTFTSRELCY